MFLKASFTKPNKDMEQSYKCGKSHWRVKEISCLLKRLHTKCSMKFELPELWTVLVSYEQRDKSSS